MRFFAAVLFPPGGRERGRGCGRQGLPTGLGCPAGWCAAAGQPVSEGPDVRGPGAAAPTDELRAANLTFSGFSRTARTLPLPARAWPVSESHLMPDASSSLDVRLALGFWASILWRRGAG